MEEQNGGEVRSFEGIFSVLGWKNWRCWILGLRSGNFWEWWYV